MSIKFDGTSQILRSATTAPYGLEARQPWYFGGWFNLTSFPSLAPVMNTRLTGSATIKYIQFNGGALQVGEYDGTSFQISWTHTLVAGRWYYISGGWDRSVFRLFVDGTQIVAGTVGGSSDSPSSKEFCIMGDDSLSRYVAGEAACVELRTVFPRDREILAIAQGTPAPIVQPRGLMAFWPLQTKDDLNDTIGGFPMTNVGTPTQGTSTPPIYRGGRMIARRSRTGVATSPPPPTRQSLPLLGVGA